VGAHLPTQLPISTLYILSYKYSECLEKRKRWDHVTVIELKDRTHQHNVECKFCKHVFVAGASRIREHFLNINPTCGVAKCTADEAVLLPVLDEMGAIDTQNKAAAAALEQCQLGRSTVANASNSSAPATKQRTLVVCRRAVSRLG